MLLCVSHKEKDYIHLRLRFEKRFGMLERNTEIGHSSFSSFLRKPWWERYQWEHFPQLRVFNHHCIISEVIIPEWAYILQTLGVVLAGQLMCCNYLQWYHIEDILHWVVAGYYNFCMYKGEHVRYVYPSPHRHHHHLCHHPIPITTNRISMYIYEIECILKIVTLYERVLN